MITIRESDDKITAKTFDELITKLENHGYSCGRYYDVEPDNNWLYITKNDDPYEAEFYRYRDGEYELYLNNIHPTKEKNESIKSNINESEYPYVMWVLDGDSREWKMYKGMNKPKSAVDSDDYDDILDKLNKQVYPNGTYYNNYIDWVVIPAGENPKTFNSNKFYGDLAKESESINKRRKLKEAESYGWVVEDWQAQEAYEFACNAMGENYVNEQIISCISNEELASCLAYIFRMNDFREWDEYLEGQEDDE